MTNRYHATPYDISASGFYFEDLDDYAAKAATHRNAYGQPVEEYEIQFIDGDNCRLFEALGINQANLPLWFDHFEGMDDDDAVKAIYLAEIEGVPAGEIPDRLDDVILFEGSAADYAGELIADCGLLDAMPENLRYYFDTQAFARDMVLSGDISEIEIDGRTFIVQAA